MLGYLPRFARPFTQRSISFLAGAMSGSSAEPQPFTFRKYQPHQPDGPFPYTKQDLTPTEAGGDASFYRVPRFVTHIDDNAIATLRKYYAEELPKSGSILDFCSSWISHYPPEIETAATAGALQILGTGMSKSELSQNPVLHAWAVQNLNEDPIVGLPFKEGGKPAAAIDASTCVVSIDYLTNPVEVLSSLRQTTNPGGRVHLIISNRCFPTKVVGRWLKIDENARLEMVGDYLWWAGWRNIEIGVLVEGTWTRDPLWVVRGTYIESEAGE